MVRLQCFEGMKAYIDSANKIRMFRPDMNMIRMNSSNKRLGMPVKQYCSTHDVSPHTDDAMLDDIALMMFD